MTGPTQNESTTAATATGATGGTLMVALINLIPPEKNALKQIFLLLAPTLTVTVRSVYLWIQRRISRSVSIWEERDEFHSIRLEIELLLQSENMSEKTRQELTNKLEEARVAYIERRLQRLKGKKT